MTHFDRPLIEAAIRNGADVSAAEASALLAEIDRSADAQRDRDRYLAVAGRREYRISRAIGILRSVERDDDIDAYGHAIEQAIDALRGDGQ